MSDAEFVATMSLTISLALLLVIWRFMSGFRSDNLRDQLFTLRDEMFLYALDQGFANTAAHENLRRLMNSLIRYAHRVSLARLLLLDCSRRIFKLNPGIPPSYVEWIQAVDRLPPEKGLRMREFHATAMILMMKHMIAGSPFLWFVSGLVAFHVVVFKSTRLLIDAIVSAITQRVPSMGLFEADALRTM
jgi:hypothetical protein